MSFYLKHVFFCINSRENNAKCCQQGNARDLCAYAKEKLKSLGLLGKGQMRINSAGCLDRCAEGPVLVVYPEGIWYTYNNKEDIDEIINEYLLNGRLVTRLLR